MSAKFVAAFRAYEWDDAIAELARRFFAACPEARCVVLADETRGPINAGGYEKITHTDDTSFLEIPNFPPGRSLWFNVDYGIYFLRKALPDYDYYILSESDLAVNLTLTPMMSYVAKNGIDLLTSRLRQPDTGWNWHKNAIEHFSGYLATILFFMILSGRAADALLAARQEFARRYEKTGIRSWPFCESFVPTVLKNISGMRFADVADFALVKNLQYRPRISLRDPRANQPGSLVHSVLGGKRFLSAFISENPPRDFFKVDSELRRGLAYEPFDDVRASLYLAFLNAGDSGGIALLEKEVASRAAASVASTSAPLSASDPRDYFLISSDFRRALDQRNFEDYAYALYQSFLAARDHSGAEKFRSEMMERGMKLPPNRDLACGKPAVSSSTSGFSHYGDPQRDACGANGNEIAADFGFHTSQEDNPWWMVDLSDESVIDSVQIVNRATCSERFSSFTIQSSRDGSNWNTRYIKLDLTEVSSNPDCPWTFDFADPFVARYVRIVSLQKRTFLHLRRVQIFGRGLA